MHSAPPSRHSGGMMPTKIDEIRERWRDTQYSLDRIDGEMKAVLSVDAAEFLIRGGDELFIALDAAQRENERLRELEGAESVLLTVAEIADLCGFTDAHNSHPETEIVVCRAPKERNCKHVAYFYEYPDEGSQRLGSALEAAQEVIDAKDD